MKGYMTHKKIIFLSIAGMLAAAIPFIINEAYKCGFGYVTVWDGSDMLAFYGNILTAVAAVVGVYFTLDYSRHKQIEYEKLRVKPYLDINTFCKISDDKNIFEFNQNEIYVYKNFDKNSHVEATVNSVPFTLYHNKSNVGAVKDIIDNSIFFNLSIKNIGCDSAIKIKIELNNEEIVRKLSISRDETKILKILIVFDKKSEEEGTLKVKDIQIKISYENVFGNQSYEQTGYIDCISYGKESGSYSYISSRGLFDIQTEIND